MGSIEGHNPELWDLVFQLFYEMNERLDAMEADLSNREWAGCSAMRIQELLSRLQSMLNEMKGV